MEFIYKINDINEKLTIKHDNHSSKSYHGYSYKRSDPSKAIWTIEKESVSGTVTTRETKGDFDLVWDDREEIFD